MEHYEQRCLPIFPIRQQFHLLVHLARQHRLSSSPTSRTGRRACRRSACSRRSTTAAPRLHQASALCAGRQPPARPRRAGLFLLGLGARPARPVQVGASPGSDRRTRRSCSAMPSRRVNGRDAAVELLFLGLSAGRRPMRPIVSQNYTDWAPTRPDPRADLGPGRRARSGRRCRPADCSIRPPTRGCARASDRGAAADLGPYRPLAPRGASGDRKGDQNTVTVPFSEARAQGRARTSRPGAGKPTASWCRLSVRLRARRRG